MTGPQINVGVRADVDLDPGFREGLADAQRFVEKLRAELAAKSQQIGKALLAGLISPEQAAAAGASVGKEFTRAVNLELTNAKREGAALGPTGQGYLSGLTTAFEKVDSGGRAARVGVNSLRGAMTSLASQAIGLPGPLGSVAGILGQMSAGGQIVVGVLAGITAISAAYEFMTVKSRAASRDLEESANRIAALRSDSSSPIQFDIDVTKAKAHIDEMITRMAQLRGIAAALRGGGGAAGGFLADLLGDSADERARDVARTQAGLTEAPNRQLKAEADALATLIREQVASNAQRQRALAIIKSTADEVKRLQASDTGWLSEAARRQVAKDAGDLAAIQHALQAAFDVGTKKTDDAAKAAERLAARQKAAAESALAAQSRLNAESAGLADQARDVLVRSTVSVIDNAQRALDKFQHSIVEARAKGAAIDPTVDRAQDVLIQQVELARKAEELEKARTVTAAATHVEMAAIADDLVRSTAADLRILDAEAQRARQARALEESTASVALAAGETLRVAAGIAQAFAGANIEIVQMLGGLGDMATGIGEVLDRASRAGGLAKLFSTAGGIASAIPAIGGIVGGGAALFSALMRDPAEEAAQRDLIAANEQTAKALHDLTTKLGQIDIANSAANRAQTLRIAAAAGSAGGFTATGAVSPSAALASVLKAEGITFEEFKTRAQALGVTLTDLAHVTLQQLHDIGVAAAAAGNVFAEMEARWQVLNTSATDRMDQFLNFVQEKFPGAIADFIGSFKTQFNLTSAEGREAAKAFVREFFAQIKSPLSPDLANRLIEGIDAIGAASGTTAISADAAAAALDRLNANLSDIALLGDLLGHSTEDIYKSIDAAAEAFPRLSDAIRGLVAGIDFSTPEGRATFTNRIRNFATELAKGGITPEEREVLQFLHSLVPAVDALGKATEVATPAIEGATGAVNDFAAATQSLADTISAGISQIQSDGELLGLTQQQIDEKTQDFLNSNPDIAGLFGRTNLGNRAQTETQQQHAREILSASPIGPSADAARRFLDFINPFLARGVTVFGEPGAPLSKAGGRIGSELQSLTQETGARMADIEAGQLAELVAIRRLIASFNPSGFPPIPVPSLALLGAGGGATTVNLSLNVAVNGIGGSATDIDDDAFARRLERTIARHLANPNNVLRRAMDDAFGVDFNFAQIGRVVS